MHDDLCLIKHTLTQLTVYNIKVVKLIIINDLLFVSFKLNKYCSRLKTTVNPIVSL